MQVETDDPKVQAAIRAAMGSKDKEGGEALSRMLSASEVMMKDLKKQQEAATLSGRLRCLPAALLALHACHSLLRNSFSSSLADLIAC